VFWLFGMAGAMGVYAMPSWDDPPVHVVKVRQVPPVVPAPVEVKR
jgi:hypothetical protein